MKIKEIKKILVPVDGSQEAVSACIWAVSIAKRTGAGVVLLHVVDMNQMSIMDRVSVSGYVPDKLKKEGKRLLSEYTSHLTDKVGIGTMLRMGDPGKVIVEEAEEQEIDLIVMGSTGQSELVSLVMGSVSQYVLHHTNLPVMIVKDEDSAAEGFSIRDEI